MSEERVVPGKTNIVNVMKHIARYNIALSACERKDVLDCACGSGYGSFLLSQVSNTVCGIDIAKDAISHAEENYSRGNITFHQRSAEDLLSVFKEDCFDTIVCFETLEHLEDPVKVLADFKKLLKKDGTLIASVPLNEDPGQNEHHKHVYDLTSALGLFNKNGFLLNSDTVQSGINFYDYDHPINKEKFVYYVGSYKNLK